MPRRAGASTAWWLPCPRGDAQLTCWPSGRAAQGHPPQHQQLCSLQLTDRRGRGWPPPCRGAVIDGARDAQLMMLSGFALEMLGAAEKAPLDSRTAIGRAITQARPARAPRPIPDGACWAPPCAGWPGPLTVCWL